MQKKGWLLDVLRAAVFGHALFFCFAIISGTAHAQVSVFDSPNVVLIFADDVGYGDTGAFGATDIQTPNIDRLADEGSMLTSFYTAPSCSLSRTMLMTGSYAPRSSASRNFTPSSPVGIHADELTLAELFKSAGYVTGIFGKWHLGDHYEFRPLRHGFDQFYGIPYSNDMWPFHHLMMPSEDEDPRTTAARERAELTGHPSEGKIIPLGEGAPNLPLFDNDTIVAFNPQQSTFGSIFIDRALSFIEQNSGKRFFAYIPVTAAHVPLHPGPDFLGTSTRDLYGDTLQELDYGVGRILAKLVELGIDNQTLVIFLSDNGPWLDFGIDGGSANPLSGGKESQFEGGIRVPAMWRWPGQLQSGITVVAPVSLVDMLPTFAALPGTSLPTDRTLDGVNVWPLISGQVTHISRDTVFGFNEVDFGNVDLGAIRSGDWKLHVDTSGRSVLPIALFNLASDIDESTNLRSSEPGVVSALVALGERLVSDILDNKRPLGTVAVSSKPFAQKSGVGDLIAMEAENYHEQLPRSGHSWEVVSLSHSSFASSLQALPDHGMNNQDNYETQSPQLRYRVVFETAGRFYVWARARASSTSNDSLHVGFNGQGIASGRAISEIFDGWTWTSARSDGGRAYIDVPSPGEHVVDVWMREDGVILDKLVLTTDPAFEPRGKGIVQSRQSYDGLAVPPTAADDGPYIADEGGAVQGEPNVLDNDGGDPRNDPVNAVLVSAPANAMLFELLPDGTFTYQHDGSETTTDSFTYTANDVDGASNVATVSLDINPVNDVPVISLIGAATVIVKVGEAYTEPGYTAEDAEDGEITNQVVVGGDAVNLATAGTYVITYDVTDSEGAPAAQVVRTVIVATDNVPVITLIGDPVVTVAAGVAYTDAGAVAQDAEDGDISAQIVVGGDFVDTDTVGTYVITYNVTDSGGNSAPAVSRTVMVVANEIPVITLNGSAFVRLRIGNSYTDAGASAWDAEDGDITAAIVVGGDTVNSAVPGTYVITYNVTDSAGNAADEVIRSVNVNPSPQSSGGGGGPLGLWDLAGLALLILVGTRAIRPD
jgi:arylsulfatase A-like enzyme